MNLIVLAKAPLPGRSKTRLCPPCTPEEAALIAHVALAETLAALGRTDADRRVVVLDGRRGNWLPAGFDVVAQRGRGLDERIAAAFEDVGGPALLVGMDTPQLTPELLGDACAALTRDGVDAVLGEALDGGWWALGLRRPDQLALLGVPMSTRRTAQVQRDRLRSRGLALAELPRLRDVDRFSDALDVAAEIPASKFAITVRGMRIASASRPPAPIRRRPLQPVAGATQ